MAMTDTDALIQRARDTATSLLQVKRGDATAPLLRALAAAVEVERAAKEAAEAELNAANAAMDEAIQRMMADLGELDAARARADRLEQAIRQAPHAISECVTQFNPTAPCDCGVEAWRAKALSETNESSSQSG